MASIDVVSTGTIAVNRVPTRMIFYTGTDAAPSVLTEALRLDEAQKASFAGTVNVAGLLNITGNVEASGYVNVATTLQVAGITTLSANVLMTGAMFNVSTGNAHVGNKLVVDGLSTLTGNVSASGDVAVSGNVSALGTAAFGNTTVTGFANVTTTLRVAGNTTLLGGTILSGYEVQNGTISPTQIVANTDDYAPTGLATARTIRLNVDAARNITGIVAQAAGTLLRLINTTAFAITLKHQTTSSAANQFFCPGAADYVLNQGGTVEVWYDGTSTYWRVLEN